MTITMPTATVSIVSHGHGPMLDNVLRDLSCQTARGRLTVVITLNLPNERFDAAAYPSLKIVVVRNNVPRGFGANHNAAFAHCNDDWFFIVNPDVRIQDASAIERLIEPKRIGQIGANPGLVVPRIVNSVGAREDSVRPNLTPWSLAMRILRGRRGALAATSTRAGKPFFWVAGMFVAAWSDSFKELDGFDERFFLYCEDYDLSARVYLSGRSIIVREDVQVIHDAQRSSHRSSFYLKLHAASLLKVWTSSTFWGIVLSRKA